MKTFIAASLFLLTTFVCKAQTNKAISATDSKINNKIDELKRNKTDTIICYYVYCTGCARRTRPDTCLASIIKYLLWLNGSKHYMQRFDECKEHGVSELGKGVFDLLKDNYSKVKSDEIKDPEYTINEKGKLNTYTVSIDDDWYYMFEIYAKDDVLKKEIDDYALKTKYVNQGNRKYKNRNYAANQQSILKKLKILIERSINDYNNKKF